MKKKILSILIMCIFAFSSVGCSCFDSKKDKIDFSITSESSVYYIGGNNIIIDFSADSVFDVDNKKVRNIEYFIVGDNNVKGEIVNEGKYATFSAEEIGTVKIQAKYKDVLSTNVLEIICDLNNEEIRDDVESVFSWPVSLGYEYEIGVDVNDDIEIIDAEGILKVTDDNKIEVIGIGEGKISIKRNGAVLFEGDYSVRRDGNISLVLKELLKLGKINSLEEDVVNSKFALLETLDLSNDKSTDITFIKYCSNLKKLILNNKNMFSSSYFKEVNLLSNLEELYIDNANVSELVFDELVSLNKLKILSMKNNERVTSVDSLSNFSNLEYLDLSNTSVSDISVLSQLSKLKDINLEGTKVENIDSLSGLTNLLYLNVSNLNISFSKISSLSNFNNLKGLQIDGFNDVDLEKLTSVTSLIKLSISNCDLVNKNSALLNNLINLEYLDISFNGFDDENFDLFLDGEKLEHLSTVRIGGNNFTVLPNLLGVYRTINVLDLSHSYYLENIEELKTYVNMEELVLDYCNKLDFGDSGQYLRDIFYNTICQRLSVVGALMSFDSYEFDYILNQSYASIRISGEKYYQKDEEGFMQGYYTSLLDYAATLEKNHSNQYIVKQLGDTKDIVLYLIGNEEIITEYYNFYVPYNIDSITIYGRGGYDLKIAFSCEGEVKFYFADIYSIAETVFLSGDDVSVISIYEGSGINGAKGQVDYKKHIDGYSAIKATHVYLTAYGDASLTIKGGNGDGGVIGESGNYSSDEYPKKGGSGSDGGIGVDCSSLTIDSANITIKGGDGGSGGQGGLGISGSIFSSNKWGGDGGVGGNGGSGVLYNSSFTNEKNALIEGGSPGDGGNAGSGQISACDGDVGEAGEVGEDVEKR